MDKLREDERDARDTLLASLQDKYENQIEDIKQQMEHLASEEELRQAHHRQ